MNSCLISPSTKLNMDGYGDSRKLSVSVRNALSVNNVKNHELCKTVKSLEAKRDQELLSLQVKKDRVISSAPGINKGVTSATSDSRSLYTPQLSECGSNRLLSSLNRGDSLIRAHSLPPLNQPSRVLGTPPRLRRAATLQEEKTQLIPAPPVSPRPRRAGSVQQPNHALSPPCTPTQAWHFSPQATRKFLSIQLSSPGMMLSNSITNSSRDFSHAEETLECQHRFSPRGRSSVAGVLPSSAGATFPGRGTEGSDALGRPRSTTIDAENSGGVHRGLHLRPVSSSATEQKKPPKDITKTTVFSRLYKNVKQVGAAEKSSASRRTNSAGSRRFSGRRRSISMPDLSEMMENLKTCRYLRGADLADDPAPSESDEEIASHVE